MKKIIIDNKEFEISEESYEAFKKQFVKDDKRWKPEINKDYWYINNYEEVLPSTWFDDKFDNIQYNNKNVYKTMAEAQRALDILNILNEYRYDFSEEEWKDNYIGKYYLYYDFCQNKLTYNYNNDCKVALRYFKDRETAEKVAELIGAEDYKKYIALGGIK